MVDIEEFCFARWSAVQAWRNFRSKPLLANAEVSVCRVRSVDVSDVVIQLMSSMDLRKNSAEAIRSNFGCDELHDDELHDSNGIKVGRKTTFYQKDNP